MSDRGGINGFVRADTRLRDFKVTVWSATRYGLRVERSTKVSPSGRFTLKAVPFGEYLVVAHPAYDEPHRYAPASFPPGAGRSGEYVTVDSIEPLEIELPVTAGAILEGRIEGIPKSDLDEATVRLVGPDHVTLRAFVRFEFDGGRKWRLTGVPPGRWTVLFTPGEAGRKWAPTYPGGAVDLQDAEFVEVVSGSEVQLGIDPQPAGSIAGVVLGPLDATMGWNLVIVERWRPPTPWLTIVDSESNFELGERWDLLYRLDVHVDARGGFLFDGLAAGRYRLRVNAATVENESLWSPWYPDAVFADDAQVIEVVAGRTTQLEPIQLLSITGHQEPVMTLEGRPEVGATLTATITDQHPDAQVVFKWSRDSHEIHGERKSTYEVTAEDIGTELSVHADLDGRGIGGYFCYEMMRVRIGADAAGESSSESLSLDDLDLTAAPAFGSFLRWLESDAPETFAGLRPGSTPDAITAAEASLGIRFPADLRIVLSTIDGGELNGELLPMGRVFSLDELLDEAGMQADVGDRDGGAGATLIPFAGLDGCNFCVRIRPDEVDVVYVDDVEGIEEDERWASVDDMFARVLESIIAGTSFHHFNAAVTDGELNWDIPDD